MMTESNNIKNEQHFFSDSSFWSLAIANIITIAWALLEGWSLDLMIWVYFSQNIILGIFWPAKVFASPVDTSYIKKVRSIAFFFPQYLIVHLLYAAYLYNSFGKELSANFKYILVMAGVFFLSELISYSTVNTPNRKPLSLVKTQLFPYARTVPMHFVMCIGIISGKTSEGTRLAVMFFLLLKAFADIGMLWVERSRVLSNLVTDSFEKYEKQSRKLNNLIIDAIENIDGYFPPGYSNPKEKRQVCRFCQRIISRNETPWAIKENVVCEECYNKIEKEKGKTS